MNGIERLEEIKSRVWKDKGTYEMGDYSQREGYIYTLSDYDYEWLIEQAERVHELESFKKSVEYTVDSETLELIIDNQDSDRVLSFSETYDEKIYLLQKRVQELEDAVESYKKLSRHANISHKMAEEQNKRYREALEFYANPKTYYPQDEDYCSRITMDYGEKAREALEGEE